LHGVDGFLRAIRTPGPRTDPEQAKKEERHMARHNREARGVDQLGEVWQIDYQPDWLSRVKISRALPRGRRRSSLTLFRNPARRAEAPPGKVVRTRVRALDGSVEFQVAIEDPAAVIESIVVVMRAPGGRGRRKGVVKFLLDGKLPPPRA